MKRLLCIFLVLGVTASLSVVTSGSSQQQGGIQLIRVEQRSSYSDQRTSYKQVPLFLGEGDYAANARKALKDAGFKVAEHDSSVFDATLIVDVRYPDLESGNKIHGTLTLDAKGRAYQRSFEDEIIQSMPMNPLLFKEGAKGAMIRVDMKDFHNKLKILLLKPGE